MRERPLSKLETALAINRGIEFLESFEAKQNQNYTPIQKGEELNNLMLGIHEQLFCDSHSSNLDGQKAGDTSRARRIALRGLMSDLAETLYDHNGFFRPLSPNQLSQVLGQSYKDLDRLQPFAYGNGLATRVFFTALGRMMAAQQEVIPGIDFRRLNEADVLVLQDSKATAREIAHVFEHAMDPYRNRAPSQGEPWQEWPDKTVEIGGLRFLSFQKGQAEYLVTIHGGLVPRHKVENALAEHLQSGKMIDRFRIPMGKCEGYLDPDLAVKYSIDGTKIGDVGAPLLCMEVSPITGVTRRNGERLKEFLSQEGASLKDLADPKKAEHLKDLAGKGELRDILDVASDRMTGVMRLVNRLVKETFEGKSPVENPQFFMSMGGPGSGKGALQSIAENACGENLVVASLDASRYRSDLYKVLTLAGHHADDYLAVEDLASLIREEVKAKAKADGYNLFYDGSGVPYSGRYDKLVREFKSAGFETTVAAAECMLVVPEGREDEFGTPVATRVVDRFNHSKDPRGLPWSVTVRKHVEAPLSFLDASRDPSVDKFVLVDNAGNYGASYVMADSFSLPAREVGKLLKAQKQGTLKEALEVATARNPSLQLAHSLDKLDANNIAVLETGQQDGESELLVVYNRRRFVDMLQKGHLNRYAATETQLLDMAKHSSFHLPELDYAKDAAQTPDQLERGRITLQGPEHKEKSISFQQRLEEEQQRETELSR